MIWSDHISIPSDINSKDKMIKIGNAYTSAHTTISIVEDVDFNILEAIKSCMLHSLKCLFRDKNITKDNIEQVCIESLSGELTTDNMTAKNFILSAVTVAAEKRIEEIVSTKGEFSYWSRAWTMQELHQSNGVQYAVLSSQRGLIEVISTSSVYRWVSAVITIWNSFESEGDADITSNSNKIVKLVRSSTMLLTGREKLQLSVNTGGYEKDMTDVLLSDLISNTRCARSAKEMNEAIAIALI